MSRSKTYPQVSLFSGLNNQHKRMARYYLGFKNGSETLVDDQGHAATWLGKLPCNNTERPLIARFPGDTMWWAGAVSVSMLEHETEGAPFDPRVYAATILKEAVHKMASNSEAIDFLSGEAGKKYLARLDRRLARRRSRPSSANVGLPSPMPPKKAYAPTEILVLDSSGADADASGTPLLEVAKPESVVRIPGQQEGSFTTILPSGLIVP